ncbi:MAG: MFS transporter [Intrasporangium sp.]|uniref:MFS transporter n=1 Tax=Intrasporangium sp. TaxID=1925024 RepID=UPI0026474F18|nr:MFS transporter [Intrasporangium sp.]MDN5794933.1 MFS transporter [Intrasporangium sp.]
MSTSSSDVVERGGQLEKQTLRKVTRRLVPFMALLYFINYLDRTNIAFAKLTMSDDLGLSETAYGVAAGVFFIGYLIFEVPSNLALHRFGARRWMARILVSWGIVATAMAFVPSAGWLYFMRVLLGVAEAGFFPGMILYLTYWFPARQRVRITALFLTAIPLSSAIGAPLSGAIMEFTDGVAGLSGWRWMFIVQGAPAVILGVVTWFYLTDRPDRAKWLTSDERTWLSDTMSTESHVVSQHGWSVRRALTGGRVLALAAVYFGIVYGLYALSFFLPSMVAGFAKTFDADYSLYQIGLIVSVPFLVATALIVPWSRHSDRTGERTWHVVIPVLVAALAVPAALYLSSPLAVMALMTVTAVGIFAALPVFWALPAQFLAGAGAAAGIALINSLGNLSGFGAPFVTGWITDATGSYRPAMWLVGVILAIAAAIVLVLHRRPPASRLETSSS